LRLLLNLGPRIRRITTQRSGKNLTRSNEMEWQTKGPKSLPDKLHSDSASTAPCTRNRPLRQFLRSKAKTGNRRPDLACKITLLLAQFVPFQRQCQSLACCTSLHAHLPDSPWIARLAQLDRSCRVGWTTTYALYVVLPSTATRSIGIAY
jgi:hypothetical protein